MRFRIMLFVASALVAAAPAFAQRTSVSREFPPYDNGGKPDLTIDWTRVDSQLHDIVRHFEPDSCAVVEGAVGASGYRRILRFDTVIINAGDADLVVGDRSDPDNPYADWFYFEECHGHWHLADFANYELLNLDMTPAAVGQKQGFCMLDSFKYRDVPSSGYDCEIQGITQGWGDWYYKQLDGQWIDVTDVPAGDYLLRVTIDWADIFDEGLDVYPNVYETPVSLKDPSNKVDGD